MKIYKYAIALLVLLSAMIVSCETTNSPNTDLQTQADRLISSNSAVSSDVYELKADSRVGAIVTVNRIYDGEETTFEYVVENRITTGNPGSRTIQFFNLELPSCLDEPEFTPGLGSDGSLDEDGISWNQTISAPPSSGSSENNSKTFSITYQGNIPSGSVSAEAVSGGSSGQSYSGPVAGPVCPSVEIELTFSGSVYIDANENGKKDSGEYGLENIKVSLYSLSGSDEETLITSIITDETGEFSFNVSVPSGDFRIKVPENKVDNIYYQAITTSKDFIEVTEDVKEIHFGYKLDIDQMTKDLLSDVIKINTEPTKYWDFQLQHAGVNQRQVDENPNVDFTRAQMIALLETVEGLLPIVEIPFQFEGEGRNKINDALSILRSKKYDDPELSKFMVELLTAELNVANGLGALSPDGDINDPFNRAILIFGEALACNALGSCPEEMVTPEGSLNKLMVGTNTAGTMSNSTLSSGTMVLSAFNGTGGIGTN